MSCGKGGAKIMVCVDSGGNPPFPVNLCACLCSCAYFIFIYGYVCTQPEEQRVCGLPPGSNYCMCVHVCVRVRIPCIYGYV
jgi:hypothetical protein